MARASISTGSDRLDRDLQLFFEAAKANQLEEMSRAVSNVSITEEELRRVIPDGILRLAYVFSGAQFAVIRSQLREESRAFLDDAKQLIDRYFADVFKCEAAVKTIVRLNQSEAGDLHPLADSMNQISSISPLFTWSGTPPALVPSVRIGFMNQNKRMLLDSLFDWDDLAYVVAALTAILASLLEKSQSLVDSEQLDLSEGPRIAERLVELTASLEKVRQLGPRYGIDPEAMWSQQDP